MSEQFPGFADLPQSTRVEFVVHCSRCGRVLKNPASIERGIGPKCAAKQEADYQAEFMRMMSEGQMRLPGTDGER
jgi:hypothetical protein